MFKDIIQLQYCIKVKYNHVKVLMECCHLLLNIDIFNNFIKFQ